MICEGIFLVDAPTIETCTKYSTRISKYAKIKRFHHMHAFTTHDNTCEEYGFISYWTHICTYFPLQNTLELYGDPYNHSRTTTRQFNRWLNEYFGKDFGNRIKCAIRKYNADSGLYHDTLSLLLYVDDCGNILDILAEDYDKNLEIHCSMLV